MKIKKKVSLVLLLISLSQGIFADDLEDFRAAYALYKDGFYDVAARAFEEMAASYPASSKYYDMLYFQSIALLKQNKIQEALPPLWKLFNKKDYLAGITGDIFHDTVMTAGAKINAVTVLHIAVDMQIMDISITAHIEGERPAPGLADGQAAHFKAITPGQGDIQRPPTPEISDRLFLNTLDIV